jgi:hypothetical protein
MAAVNTQLWQGLHDNLELLLRVGIGWLLGGIIINWLDGDV